jgi:hypothetical protein
MQSRVQPKIIVASYIHRVEIFDLQIKYSLRPLGFFDSNICEFLLPVGTTLMKKKAYITTATTHVDTISIGLIIVSVSTFRHQP